ncbi:MAG: RNA polymerase sigma factor [Solirubrobacteraceae bacterium]
MEDEVDAATLEAGRARAAVRHAWSDAELVRAALTGSSAAVEALFERHWDALHRSAYWIVHDAAAAEDIAQEAFLAALRALDRFDRRRPLAPWLHRVVVNRAIDHARAVRARREVGAELVVERAAPAVEATDPDLLAALATLPVDQRAIVVMRHVIGCTPTEISAALDLPRGTVNSRLRRGLDALAGQLERDHDS